MGNRVTSHIFLSFVDNKCISAVLFFFLIWFLILLGINNNTNLLNVIKVHSAQEVIKYSFNRTKSAKLRLEVLFCSIIT